MNNQLDINDHISIRILEQGINLTLMLNRNTNAVSAVFESDTYEITQVESDESIIVDNFKISNYDGPKITVVGEYSGYCEGAIPIFGETIILSRFKISPDSEKKILNQCDIHLFKFADSEELICIISRMFSSKYFPRRDSRSYFFKIERNDLDNLIEYAFDNLEKDAFIENPLN